MVLAVKPMSVEQSQQVAWKDLDQAPVSFSNGMPVTLVELCLGEVPFGHHSWRCIWTKSIFRQPRKAWNKRCPVPSREEFRGISSWLSCRFLVLVLASGYSTLIFLKHVETHLYAMFWLSLSQPCMFSERAMWQISRNDKEWTIPYTHPF